MTNFSIYERFIMFYFLKNYYKHKNIKYIMNMQKKLIMWMKAYLGEHFGLSQLQFFWIVDELNIYIAILNINI